MSERRILFVKTCQPEPLPVATPAWEYDYHLDFRHPTSAYQVEMVIKAMREGRASVREAARAEWDFVAGRPLEHDLIQYVLTGGGRGG